MLRTRLHKKETQLRDAAELWRGLKSSLWSVGAMESSGANASLGNASPAALADVDAGRVKVPHWVLSSVMKSMAINRGGDGANGSGSQGSGTHGASASKGGVTWDCRVGRGGGSGTGIGGARSRRSPGYTNWLDSSVNNSSIGGGVSEGRDVGFSASFNTSFNATALSGFGDTSLSR